MMRRKFSQKVRLMQIQKRLNKRKSKRIKVLSICPIGGGGVGQYAHLLNNALSNIGVEVTMITTPKDEFKHSVKKYNLLHIPILLHLLDRIMSKLAEKIGVRRFFTLRGVFICLYALCKKPEIVHFQWVWNSELKADIRLIKILHFFGIKVVYTAQNILPHEEGEKHYREYKEICHLADAVIVLSPAQKQKMINLFELEQSKIYYAPTGIYALKEGNGIVASKPEARKLLGLNNTNKVALFFGYIRKYKGLDILIKAAGKIYQEMPNFKLIIAGQPVEDFRRYYALIKNQGIENNTICQLGYIPLDSIELYFMASDVVVLPYKEESLTAVIFLAYFYGKPVIGTDVLGVAEFIEEGKSGYIVPKNDENALAIKIKSLLQNEQLLNYMSSYIEKELKPKYSWREIAVSIKRIYTELVDGN
jgi:glycosyltransferase involved in cell wall biosynthesis